MKCYVDEATKKIRGTAAKKNNELERTGNVREYVRDHTVAREITSLNIYNRDL